MAEASLADIIETAKQGARKRLKEVAVEIEQMETTLASLRAEREGTVREATKVLETAEVASLLGVSVGTVGNWARDPNAPKRTRTVVAEVIEPEPDPFAS